MNKRFFLKTTAALCLAACAGLASALATFADKISGLNDDQKDRLNKTNTDIDDQIAAIERRPIGQHFAV